MAQDTKYVERNMEVLSAEFMTQLQGTSNVELVKALLVLNGGAAAALLAFLQAVWNGARPLVAPALTGIVVFGFGAAVAAGFHLIRSLALMKFQNGNEVGWKRLRRCYMTCACVSLVLFLVGVFTVALAVSRQL